MSALLENEEVWKAIAADPEVRACLRKEAMTVLSEISPESLTLYRAQVDTFRGMLARYKARIEAIDSEVGCIDVLVQKLPLEGEGAMFRALMVQKKAALLTEKEETIQKAEKVPGEAEGAERLLRAVELQLANANFLMRIVEEVEDAEGGVHRVADEPRGSGDHGTTSDPVCDV